MPATMFEPEEIADFLERFENTPQWTQWGRRDGSRGEDVIEIALAGEGKRNPVIKIAKTGPSRYVATGLSDWGLAVAESFSSLLDTLQGMAGRRSVPSGPRRAAY